MFAYEIATARRADLIREADNYRLVREARKARRAASSRSRESGGTVVTSQRSRFTPAA
ncbi:MULTISPECIES: hypothetical protein [unclassified Streptomyces]|uniref:hypothetical protein n=1 Tax=unclassified Streptomyces TaxID=2593676 RepID=UPI002E36DBFD|nr:MULTISPECIES: hypothetical protein [unclassified Streptomyces]WUC64511.1 hypothetical protein OG861_09820 [Streptomyces sp. NBC_00539]